MGFKHRFAALAAAGLAMSSAHAAIQTVDFNEAEFGGQFVVASNEYQSFGLTFEGVSFFEDTFDPAEPDFDPIDERGIFNGTVTPNGLTPAVGRINFLGGATSVGIEWFTYIDNLEIGLAAFSATDDLLDSTTIISGAIPSSGLLSVVAGAGTEIAYVLFSGVDENPVGITTLQWDDVDIDRPIPIPGAAPLFFSILAFAGYRTARKSR